MIEWNRDQRQNMWLLIVPLLCISDIPSVAGNNITGPGLQSARINDLRFQNMKYVTFDSLGSNIGIDFDLTIPFISIPLDPGSNPMGSLININAKSLTVVGIFTVLTTILVPLLFEPETMSKYRMNDANQDWLNYGETARQIFLGNSYLAPCTKKLICSVVSNACYAKHQSSMDKIIDGISSHAWFDRILKGTTIQEAITVGRKSEGNCNVVYSGCFLSKNFFKRFSDSTTVTS